MKQQNKVASGLPRNITEVGFCTHVSEMHCIHILKVAIVLVRRTCYPISLSVRTVKVAKQCENLSSGIASKLFSAIPLMLLLDKSHKPQFSAASCEIPISKDPELVRLPVKRALAIFGLVISRWCPHRRGPFLWQT